jgi:membrane dipeptidase
MKRHAIALQLLNLLCTSAFVCAEERPLVVLTERARQLHAAAILIDGHNDLPWAFRTRGMPTFEKLNIALRQPELHTDIPRLREGGVKAQFWSVYVPASTRLRGESLQTTLEQIEFVKSMIAHYPETFQFAQSTADIDLAIKNGKIASLIGVEGGHSIENSLSVLRRLYAMGARYMTLTHSQTLDWADSATDEAKHGGLNEFGVRIVREMNTLGMLVDLSHVSDDTMRDALRVTQAPVIYSHSSARAIGDHPRNVPDDVLPMVRDNGGVIMVNFYSGFIVPAAVEQRRVRDEKRRELEKTLPDEKAVNAAIAKWDASHPLPVGSIHDAVDHIDHLAKIAGVDHVGIGSDFDGIGAVPKQLEDVSTFPLITQEMLNRGYSERDIRKVLGENLLRVFREAEQVSKRLRSEP